MVPIDSGEKFSSFLAKIFSQRQKTDLSKLARNIYRLEYEEIKIDFFIYEPNYRDEAVFSGGTYPDIKLGTSFPIQTTTKPLMGKLVSVVPLQVIRLMKHYDAPIRRKGAVDLEYLNSANINYDDI